MTGTLAEVHSLAVVGLGRSGRAAALLARRELPAAAVVVVDEKDEDELGSAPAELRAAGADLLLGVAAALPEGVDLVVKSPGVPSSSPVVVAALARGVTIWSEVEFAARFLANRWMAITGTNGKTTTTELTGQILRDAGRPVEVAGNVGRALANLPGLIDPEAVVVAELSSFQLEHIERFRPDVAVLLNLTEDHIDRHGSFAGYVEAKLRIFENQTPGELALVNSRRSRHHGGRCRRSAGPRSPGRFCSVRPGLGRAGVAGGAPVPSPAGGSGVAPLAGVRDGVLWLQTSAGRGSCARSRPSPSRASTTWPTRWRPRPRPRRSAWRPPTSPAPCKAFPASSIAFRSWASSPG